MEAGHFSTHDTLRMTYKGRVRHIGIEESGPTINTHAVQTMQCSRS